MIIDSHAHIIVPEITRAAAPAEAWRPQVTWDNGKQFVEYAGKRIGSATREFVQPDKILAEMDRCGVDGVLLCPWVSLVRYDARLVTPAQIAQHLERLTGYRATLLAGETQPRPRSR